MKKWFHAGWIQAFFTWTLGLILLALSVVAVAAWNLPAAWDWYEAQGRLREMRTRLEGEERSVSLLRTERDRLEKDLPALERAAREEFLLARPNEEIYIYETPGRAKF